MNPDPAGPATGPTGPSTGPTGPATGPTGPSTGPTGPAALAAARWAEDPASRRAGLDVLGVAAGRAEIAMTVLDDMVNGHGICHGGMIFMLADSAFAVACNSHGEPCLAAGASIEYLSPARLGERLVATARERTRGPRSGLTDVEVHGSDGRLIAVFHGRSARLSRPADRG